MLSLEYVKQIDLLLKTKEFSGLAELLVFLALAENKRLTNNDICKNLNINAGYVRNILSQMKLKGIVDSVDDDRDTRKTSLTRQLYSLSSKGINLYRKMQNDKTLENK